MPAKRDSIASKKGAYTHIYNMGIDKKSIFVDDADYETFISFLKEYLTKPADSEIVKKTFTVNGKAFKGIPHQPKNYYEKIELLGYGLSSDQFNLVVRQVETGALERFLRSLSTRYSMYFNKKYKRSGTLFQGPYKSEFLHDLSKVIDLTAKLHAVCSHSSMAEFTGAKISPWVKPTHLLTFFNESKTTIYAGVHDYTDLVARYKPVVTQKHAQSLKKVEPARNVEPDKKVDKANNNQNTKEPLTGSNVLERSEPVSKVVAEPNMLERRDPSLERSQDNLPRHKQPQKHGGLFEFLPAPTWLEITGIIGVFIVLFGLGIRNINANPASVIPQKTAIEDIPEITPIPEVSGAKTENESPVVVQSLKIKSLNKSEVVNVRKEPSLKSPKIAKVKSGEIYIFIDNADDWYQIILNDGQHGYISSSFIEVLSENK